MKFLELNADVVDLRKSLLNFVGEAALREVTVRPPVSHSGRGVIFCDWLVGPMRYFLKQGE